MNPEINADVDLVEARIVELSEQREELLRNWNHGDAPTVKALMGARLRAIDTELTELKSWTERRNPESVRTGSG